MNPMLVFLFLRPNVVLSQVNMLHWRLTDRADENLKPGNLCVSDLKFWVERCGTREDSLGHNGRWASSSGCNLSSTSKIQVSKWFICTMKLPFLQINVVPCGCFSWTLFRPSGLGCPGTGMDSSKGVHRSRTAAPCSTPRSASCSTPYSAPYSTPYSAQWPGHPRTWACRTDQPQHLPGWTIIWQSVAAGYMLICLNCSYAIVFFLLWIAAQKVE